MDVERFAILVGERLRRPRRNERRSRGERLADALASLLRSGDLLAGTRLPSERALGAALGMSRGTVASALDQLAEAGLVERRHGSGTYVRSGVGGVVGVVGGGAGAADGDVGAGRAAEDNAGAGRAADGNAGPGRAADDIGDAGPAAGSHAGVSRAADDNASVSVGPAADRGAGVGCAGDDSTSAGTGRTGDDRAEAGAGPVGASHAGASHAGASHAGASHAGASHAGAGRPAAGSTAAGSTGEAGRAKARSRGGGEARTGRLSASEGTPAFDEPIFSRWIREGTVVVDLAKSVVPDTSLLPRLDLSVEDLLDVHPADGYGLLGEVRLRELLAEQAAPEPFGADVLLVTAGAQQALHLVADALLAPGDRVLVDGETYPGMLAAIERFGGVPVVVEGDRYGMVPEAFGAAVVRHRPAFAFTMPVHNPTGRVAATGRVRALARAAREGDLLLVEDRTLADLVLTEPISDARPVVPSAAVFAPDHTVCLGSLSKVLWGGLRVGWLAAPEPVFERFVQAKRRTDLATSALDQRLAIALSEDPGAAARKAAWRADLRVRRDHLADLLAERIPEWRWSRPHGGMSLWVRLPGADGEEFAAASRRHGVSVSPGAVFGPGAGDRIRLSFAWPEPVLSEAVAMLRSAWAEYRQR